jgi:hypothetical protein
MSKLQVGDRVKHDFSLDHGTIKQVRKDPGGYNYFVEWDFPDRADQNDWYKSEVLVLL